MTFIICVINYFCGPYFIFTLSLFIRFCLGGALSTIKPGQDDQHGIYPVQKLYRREKGYTPQWPNLTESMNAEKCTFPVEKSAFQVKKSTVATEVTNKNTSKASNQLSIFL
jgi:hypothetical protein